MAGLVLRKAQRKQAYLKLGMSAPSGGGKTIGALIIAYGMLKEKYPNIPDSEIWEKVAVLDTENGSGELYVNHLVGNLSIGEYSVIPVSAKSLGNVEIGCHCMLFLHTVTIQTNKFPTHRAFVWNIEKTI